MAQVKARDSSHKSSRRVRKHCDCGEVATVMDGNEMVCSRCKKLNANWQQWQARRKKTQNY